MAEPAAGEGEDWVGGWEADERRQRQAWLRTTPLQRLEWLEAAIAFAHEAGVLPRRDQRVDAQLTVGDPPDGPPAAN